MHWRRKWQPTPVFLPGESQGQRSLAAVPGGASGKEPACQCRKYNETQVQFLGWEDPLEEGMATHFSIPAWRIPRTEEPGMLQSIELHRVRHD